MIVRGTTPYQRFLLPLNVEEIAEIYVTYLQNEEIVLEKDKTQVTITNMEDLLENASMGEDLDYEIDEDLLDTSQLEVHLSQEDTLKFHFYPAAKKNIAVIQIRLRTTNGEAYASDPINERIMGVLKQGVI